MQQMLAGLVQREGLNLRTQRSLDVPSVMLETSVVVCPSYGFRMQGECYIMNYSRNLKKASKLRLDYGTILAAIQTSFRRAPKSRLIWARRDCKIVNHNKPISGSRGAFSRILVLTLTRFCIEKVIRKLSTVALLFDLQFYRVALLLNAPDEEVAGIRL